MKKMTLTLSAVLAAAVLTAGAIQARGPASATPRAASAAGAPAVTAHALVAADGRVVTYPGGEVIVGAERAGRVVRLLVDEGRVVRHHELPGGAGLPQIFQGAVVHDESVLMLLHWEGRYLMP